MSDLRTAAQQALAAYDQHEPLAVVMEAIRAALADGDKASPTVKESLTAEPADPVAWSHNFITGNVITHRPADIDRHPDRWTALYPEPKPCPTCEALARTVMMDQTSHDAPPQRKPLTERAEDRTDWSAA